MSEEVPIPTPPLSAEEVATFEKLGSEELSAIDDGILSCARPHWRKVAMIVGQTMQKLADRFPQFSDTFYAHRVRTLADKGRLESQGNLSYMRFSEVKLPAHHVMHIGNHLALVFALVGMLQGSSAFASDKQQLVTGIEGLWSGADTNDPSGSAFLCIKFGTNGQGAFVSGALIAIPATFTYTLSQGRIDYVTNNTIPLNGTLRYDSAADLVVYQGKPPRRASRTANSQGPVIMSRDSDELKNTILGLVLGATNEEEVMTRIRPVLETLRHATNYDDAVARVRPVLGAITNRVKSVSGESSRSVEQPREASSATNRQDSPAPNR